MMALSEHPKSREVNTLPVSGLADPALPLGGYRIRGCGVVVAQEPSKLLGPVRVWSAAPDLISPRITLNALTAMHDPL